MRTDTLQINQNYDRKYYHRIPTLKFLGEKCKTFIINAKISAEVVIHRSSGTADYPAPDA